MLQPKVFDTDFLLILEGLTINAPMGCNLVSPKVELGIYIIDALLANYTWTTALITRQSNSENRQGAMKTPAGCRKIPYPINLLD